MTHRGHTQMVDMEMRIAKFSDGSVWVSFEDLGALVNWLGSEEVRSEEGREKMRKANVQKRLSRFRDEAMKVHKESRILDNEQAKAWFEYWTERGMDDMKHRWEKETSFDIKKRMIRWRDNPNQRKPAQEKMQFSGPRS